jgi:excisionase family DNA binding protein
MTTTPPAHLSLKECARRLGFDQATVARLIESGKGPGIKVHGRYLIYETWVERWLAGDAGFWGPGIVAEPELRSVDSPFIRRIAS